MGFYSYVVYEHKLEDSMGGVNYTQHQDGIFDAGTMTPMLHFMEAESYCDYLAERILSGYQIELIEKAHSHRRAGSGCDYAYGCA